MYVTITDIVSEKRISLNYPIWGKKAVIISMFSDNIQYKIKETLKVLLITNEEKWLPEVVFMGRELSMFIARKVITTPLDVNDHIVKTDMLAHFMEVVRSLDELNNNDNLDDRPQKCATSVLVPSDC